MSSRLSLHAAPAAGFDEPFEMLLACHQRVARMLGLLERLGVHAQVHGFDGDARVAAADVMRYFDLAGPAHHEDEERNLFPLLRAGGEPALASLVERLQAEHLEMSRQWQAVRADLATVAAGEEPPGGPVAFLDAARPRWARFAALYAGHIEAEEGRAYPAAEALAGEAVRREMGEEMAARRGVRPAAATPPDWRSTARPTQGPAEAPATARSWFGLGPTDARPTPD